jgi:hypothetical protein
MLQQVHRAAARDASSTLSLGVTVGDGEGSEGHSGSSVGSGMTTVRRIKHLSILEHRASFGLPHSPPNRPL